jgi:hypothetical protein
MISFIQLPFSDKQILAKMRYAYDGITIKTVVEHVPLSAIGGLALISLEDGSGILSMEQWGWTSNDGFGNIVAVYLADRDVLYVQSAARYRTSQSNDKRIKRLDNHLKGA